MSKFRHASPKPGPDPAAVAAFAAGADTRSLEPMASIPPPVVASDVVSTDTKSVDMVSNQITSTDMTASLPWAEANPRVIRPFQLRLPEPTHAKLAWLSEQGEGSIHELVMAGVGAEIERRLAKRGE